MFKFPMFGFSVPLVTLHTVSAKTNVADLVTKPLNGPQVATLSQLFKLVDSSNDFAQFAYRAHGCTSREHEGGTLGRHVECPDLLLL